MFWGTYDKSGCTILNTLKKIRETKQELQKSRGDQISGQDVEFFPWYSGLLPPLRYLQNKNSIPNYVIAELAFRTTSL